MDRACIVMKVQDKYFQFVNVTTYYQSWCSYNLIYLPTHLSLTSPYANTINFKNLNSISLQPGGLNLQIRLFSLKEYIVWNI